MEYEIFNMYKNSVIVLFSKLLQTRNAEDMPTYHMACRAGWSTQLNTGAARVVATSSSCIPVFHLLMAVGESWAVACVTSKYRLSVLWNEITFGKSEASSHIQQSYYCNEM